MAAPQVTFPGVQAVISARIVRTHGVSPNAITLNVGPQADFPDPIGDLLIRWDDIELTIPDCLVDRASIQRDPRRRIITIMLLDRRWRWQFCGINGHYNRRNESGEIVTSLEPSISSANNSERTPRELASLLFESMGETGFDISQLPQDVRPEVDWRRADAGLELARLADLFRFRVVLGFDNVVRLLPLDDVDNSPRDVPIIWLAQTVDPVDRPTAIVAVTEPILHQLDMLLEAVGEDVDGAIKPIELLSFSPDFNAEASGWFDAFDGQGFWDDDEDIRKLANASVFKWYRIALPFDFPDVFQNEDGTTSPITIENMEQVAPILSFQAATVDEDGRLRNRPAIVYGRWFDSDLGESANTSPIDVQPLPQDVDPEEKTIIPGGFVIDGRKGVVKFSRPITALTEGQDDPIDNGATELPILYLRAAFQIRRNDGHWRTREIRRDQPQPRQNTRPLFVPVHELIPVQQVRYDFGGEINPFENQRIVNNFVAVDEVANKYIDFAERSFDVNDPTTINYAGLVPSLDLNGRIRSIEIVIDSSGQQPVSTTAQIGQDLQTGNLSYLRMRHEQRVQRIIGEVIDPLARVRREMEKELRT